MIPIEQVGPVEIRVFQRRTDWTLETRLDIRTAWGAGVNTSVRHLPELIAALQRTERAARKAGLFTPTDAAARGGTPSKSLPGDEQ